MLLKTIIDEDFVNYKVPSMFIGTAFCGGKCCVEAGIPLSVCQNDEWRKANPIFVEDSDICRRYLNNNITSAIVIGGLEPFEQFSELCELLAALRNKYKCNDDVVIYTGYYPDEIVSEIELLKFYGNIIVKFGRYIPNKPHRYDELLGVELASDNQFSERIC